MISRFSKIFVEGQEAKKKKIHQHDTMDKF